MECFLTCSVAGLFMVEPLLVSDARAMEQSGMEVGGVMNGELCGLFSG